MNRLPIGLAAIACSLLFALPASAIVCQAPIMTKPPTMDGVIRPVEWQDSLRADGFAWHGVLERRRATGYIGATETTLYLGIRSQLPAEGTLLADVDRDTENLVYDDAAEVWIDPTPDAAHGHRYQLLLNSTNHAWYRLHPYGGEPENPTWSGHWTVKNAIHDGWWDTEIAIPINSIAPGRHIQDGSWGLNLCRDWKNDWAWSSLGGDDYTPSVQVSFSPTAPAISLEQRGDPFTGNVQSLLTLRNPGVVPIPLKASLDLNRDVMPQAKQASTFTLAPGANRQLDVQVQDAATKKYTLSAAVQSPNAAVSYFQRSVTWAAAPPWQWTTHKKVIQPVDFQFAYYPYASRMRIRADASNLPHGAVLHSLNAIIRQKNGPTIKTVSFTHLVNGRQSLDFPLPPLRGDYEIALRAAGKGVPNQDVVKPFVRQVFPWEHNRLGKSTKVYPPFTPIRVAGARVSTVLRSHVMGSTGLWNQVSALGKDLLASPMRWEVAAAGRPAAVLPGKLKFVSVAPNQARATASFKAGPLRADSLCTWDYDGTMRLDLTLLPSGTKPINALTLVIPLREDEAILYHAMGDGIRNTLYERVPPGQGIVWTAKSVQSNDLPKNFCTYIFVGTPSRGLCWFAENDRGWGWNRSTPNLDLFRHGHEVDLRIHLINRPETITSPRILTFGLLAAPVKPRIPADWRYKYRRDHYSLLGTDINWLALGDAASVYPAGKDMNLWRAIARGNKEHLTDADIQHVIDEGRRYFEPYGQDVVNTFMAHVRYNLRARYGTKMIFYYNRASYQKADEFQTFMDEWDLTDYRTVGPGISRSEIKIVPSESYIDHALYWYGKSFDIGGNQGVYWDNWFFDGDYNTAMTGAYHDPQGAVTPSTGIWGLRELAKRTFQYMNERGMQPITMPHITSTSILPMLSFATLQYDWEWHYSEGDVQDRFSRDYILLVTDGQLAGTWPVLLNDHGPQADDPWIGRTFAAVAMLHELDCPYQRGSKVGDEQLALFRPVDDILKQPGVQAYRYWDDRPQPVRSDNPDLPTIVYSVKGKRAVFAVVSYAHSDVPAVLHINADALGFPTHYQIVDTETGQQVPALDGTLRFPLKKHDIRVFEVRPG